MIKPLTSLRFFFALFVFFSHLSFLNSSVYYSDIYNNIFSEGFLGVSFFFILSGFILAYNYQDKILDKTITLKKFYVARVARIYPMHLVSLAFSLPLFFVKDIKLLFINTFLLQSYFNDEKIYFSFNSPSWSISNELFFYTLFPFLVSFIIAKNKYVKITVLALMLLVLFYINFYTDLDKKYWLYISPFLRIIDFFIGLILFNVYRKFTVGYKNTDYATWYEFLVVLIFAAFFYFHSCLEISLRYSVYYWIPMLMVILIFALSGSSAEDKRGILSRMLSNKILVYAGEISFCFYMLHYMMIIYCKSILKHIIPDATSTVKIFFILASTITVSILAYEYVEKPLNRKVKNYFK